MLFVCCVCGVGVWCVVCSVTVKSACVLLCYLCGVAFACCGACVCVYVRV